MSGLSSIGVSTAVSPGASPTSSNGEPTQKPYRRLSWNRDQSASTTASASDNHDLHAPPLSPVAPLRSSSQTSDPHHHYPPRPPPIAVHTAAHAGSSSSNIFARELSYSPPPIHSPSQRSSFYAPPFMQEEYDLGSSAYDPWRVRGPSPSGQSMHSIPLDYSSADDDIAAAADDRDRLTTTSSNTDSRSRLATSQASQNQSAPGRDRDSAHPAAANSHHDTYAHQHQHSTPTQHHSQHQRPYDTDGNAISPLPLGLTSLSRSPTFRKMSNTLKRASVRVVNLMGSEHDGMQRLPTRDSDSDVASQAGTIATPTPSGPSTPVELHPTNSISTMPIGGLRGRTLCLFTAQSRIRRVLDKVLLYPWTEPIILILIMLYVVVLTIQSAPALFEPRPGDGFFHTWEDYALFVLFIVFTVEMFARMIVTGFVLDPETTVQSAFRRMWRFGYKRAKAEERLDTGPGKRIREPWQRYVPDPTIVNGKSSKQNDKDERIIAEAPFEEAVLRQQGLIYQGRPYMRHSWHRIDMVAIIAFWICFILAELHKEATDTRHLYIFRMLSVLRATRLLVITSGTATILHSLKRAGPLLINVSWFIVFAAAIFSIIGVQSFRGSLRRFCVLDPTNSTGSYTQLGNCGGYWQPDGDGSGMTKVSYLTLDGRNVDIEPKGYICPMGQICETQSQSQEDDNVSFDNIFKSLVQVLIIAGVNTWTDTMYQTMDAEFFGSSLFFIVAIIVLNFWLMNLLVAVVVNTFQDIRAETKRSAFGADHSLLNQPEWSTATKKKHEPGRLLKLYQKSELFWVALIVVDLIAQGCKSAAMSDWRADLLSNMELAFTFVWLFEIALRFVAYLPHWGTFFFNARNDFDLFLAIGCGIIQIPPIRHSTVYPWLTVFQLLRWYRVIMVIPRMRPLVTNVFGSFAGLLNMTFFLFLMNFVAALMAVQLIRGDMDDSEVMNFSQVYNAFLGMYQIFSTENWTDVLYGAMSAEWPFGQGWIVCIFLFIWFLFANFILMQMFIAVINENFQVAEELKRKHQIEAFIKKAEPQSTHVSRIERLNPYRLFRARHEAVKVAELPPHLILPLKQNVGADVGPGPEDQEKQTSKQSVERLLGLNKKDHAVMMPLRKLRGKKKGDDTSTHRRTKSYTDGDSSEDSDDDDRGLSELLPPINPGTTADEHKDTLREKRNQQADFIAAHPSFDRSLWVFSQGNPLRKLCQWITPPAYGQRIFGQAEKPTWNFVFRAVVFGAVVASIVVAAIATPHYRKNYYEKHGLVRTTWFDITEESLAVVFIAEFLVKVIADGFVFAPNAYLLSIWNVVDFFLLVCIVINSVSGVITISGWSRPTRAFKAMRALRLITLFSRLRDTFFAVFLAGFVRILDASVLMILYLIPFAVWGLNIFMKRLSGCNDTSGDVEVRSQCTGEYEQSPVGDINFLAPRVWANPSFGGSIWAFDDFRQSVLILFEIVSLEGWTDVMGSVMAIVGLDQQPQTNHSQWNAVFFVIFNLLGGVVILTVFLSIIILNFSARSGTALLTTEQKQWVDLANFIRQQSPSQLPENKPTNKLRRWCYDRATQKRGYWTRFFTVIYFVHIGLLMTQDWSENILDEIQFDIVFLVLTVIYAIDLIVRFVGLGFKSFRSNGWNWFDFITILGSFVTTIPALQDKTTDLNSSNATRQVQKLFLVAISLKLVQRLDSLNQLFKTSVASLPAIGNLFLLWAVFFIWMAIVMTEIFGLTKVGVHGESRFQNYHSFGNALVMLAFMSTGEGWNGHMHDYTIEYPRCTDSENWLYSDCGSVGWAYVLFIFWNLLSMYIFLNMFTGVVVQSFEYVFQRRGKSNLSREQIRSFKKAWAEVDTARTGYIKRKDFARFFSKLEGVFEVRIYEPAYSVPSLLRAAAPEPGRCGDLKRVIDCGKERVDLHKLRQELSTADFAKIRARRRQYVRLWTEARMSEEPGRGISFTQMLLMLAHYKLINDEDALRVDELLVRRAKLERVHDLVSLDRVRGLIRTIYWRRRFMAHLEAKRQNDRQSLIPAIVVDETTHYTKDPLGVLPESPSEESHSTHSHTGSLSHSHSTSMAHSPNSFTLSQTQSHSPSHTGSNDASQGDTSFASTDTNATAATGATVFTHTHASWDDTLRPTAVSRSGTIASRHSHTASVASMASEEDHSDVLDAMAGSVWGDLMREAVEEEAE